MRFEKHLASSIPLTAIVHFYFRSKIISVCFWLGYILIDIDHILDYFITCGINVNIKQFFDISYKHQYKTLILFLHSYELIALLWYYLLFNPEKMWLTGLIFGFMVHLITDQLTNQIHLMGYFIIFRIFKKFKADNIRFYKPS